MLNVKFTDKKEQDQTDKKNYNEYFNTRKISKVGEYKIKNAIKKKVFERDFSINQFNIIILIIFYIFAGILYYLFGIKIKDIKDAYIFIVLPLISILNLGIGKWEITILAFIISIATAGFTKRIDTLYFAIPAVLGTIISPVFQIIKEWERAVVLRFGRFNKVKGPGLFLLLPFADSINKIVDLRIKVTDFEAETTLTKDSVSIIVDALCFWMIWDAEKAILEVENYIDAVVLSAQAALRDAIGKIDLTNLLEKREQVAEAIRQIVDKKTNEWGITIQSIDITDIIIPYELLDSLSKKAQAEREKQARILFGEAEVEVAKKFNEASKIYQENAEALKLRKMNILYEGLKSGNSMMMVPTEILDKENIDDIFGLQALGEVKKKNKQNIINNQGGKDE